MKKRIYLSAPHMGNAELSNIHEAFDTNWISTVGPQIDKFEKLLSDFTSAHHAVALSSGTAAIHLALKALKVGEGDSVICQSFTFAGSAFPIKYVGAEPVFVDSEIDTWNMDPNVLEDAIKKVEKLTKARPKAIIPVHLYGMPAKMDEIKEIASKYEIPVIEDAAEALGSVYKGQACGSLTEIGILSFNGNKIITTSGGGALLTNSAEEKNQIKFLATQAREQAPYYQHEQVGYNYRMGNINAAIGIGQMEVLPERIRRKQEFFNFYKSQLSRVEGIEFQSEPQHVISNRWLTAINTNSAKQAKTIQKALELKNIESRPLWKPMHLQPVFAHNKYFGGSIAEGLFEKGVCLPSGTAMTDDDLDRIVKIIKKSLDY